MFCINSADVVGCGVIVHLIKQLNWWTGLAVMTQTQTINLCYRATHKWIIVEVLCQPSCLFTRQWNNYVRNGIPNSWNCYPIAYPYPSPSSVAELERRTTTVRRWFGQNKQRERPTGATMTEAVCKRNDQVEYTVVGETACSIIFLDLGWDILMAGWRDASDAARVRQ